MRDIYLDKTGKFICINSPKFIGTYDISLNYIKKNTEYWKQHLFEKNWFTQDYWDKIEKIIYEE